MFPNGELVYATLCETDE